MREEYRGFQLDSSGGLNLRRIKTIGKGTVPAHMRGMYTSSGKAKAEIDMYLTHGRKTNGKAKADAGSK